MATTSQQSAEAAARAARRIVFTLVLIVVLIIGASSSCVIVEPGNVGVQTFMGSLKDRVLEPGLSFPNVNTITHVSVQSRSYHVDYDTNHARAAVSSDMQTVGFAVDVNYYVSGPDAARELVRLVNRDPETWERLIIAPTIDQAVKTVFARYSLRNLIENRETVRTECAEAIVNLIDQRLTERDVVLRGAIRVAQVTLTNLDYSSEFEAVIEATQREEQRVRLAQNELERIRIESERQIVEAEAARRAAVERSRGVAEAMEIEAQARANTYRLLTDAGLDIATYLFLERWNGELPTVMAGENQLLSIPALGN